jgi:hypothetical protein
LDHLDNATKTPSGSDSQLLAMLPAWARSWITDLKSAVNIAHDQAMENGSAAQVKAKDNGIISFIDAPAMQEGLALILQGGMVIGAIRHGQFIPLSVDQVRAAIDAAIAACQGRG